MWYQKRVLIPDAHYVGFQDRGKEIPLGFAIPYGTDASYLKRKATVDTWSQPRRKYIMNEDGTYKRDGKGQALWEEVPQPEAKVLANKPMDGFRLTFDIRNGYKGSPDAWRVLDPRGFELEIRSDNLAQLMHFTTVKEGIIQGECIWGREGTRNVLLSVNTDDYKAAAVSTEISKKKASWRDVKIGDYVILQNGARGRYLGRYHRYESVGYSEREDGNQLKIGKPVYAFLTPYSESEYYKDKYDHSLYLLSSPKLADIETGLEMTEEEAEKAVGNLMINPRVSVSGIGYHVYFLSVRKFEMSDVTLEYVPVEYNPKWTEENYALHVNIDIPGEGRKFGRLSAHNTPTPWDRQHNWHTQNHILVSEFGPHQIKRLTGLNTASWYKHRSDITHQITKENFVDCGYVKMTMMTKLGNKLETKFNG